jgi:hypothetical protein
VASLNTYSKFYYNFVVTESNQWLDFNDGTANRSIKIPFGGYTLASLAVKIAEEMNSVAVGRTFSVTTNRLTRIYTISAVGGNFSLLFSTGTNAGLGIFSLIGFAGSDFTGASTYTGTSGCGSVYYPQYYLQGFIDADQTKFPVSAVVNKSSSGNVFEVVRFGSNRLYRFSIDWTTDLDLGSDSFIKTNLSGVSALNSFMDYCTNKYPVEIMPNENDSDDYDTIILETTPQSPDGVSYEISPDYSKNLPEFYTLGGKLVFRRVE